LKKSLKNGDVIYLPLSNAEDLVMKFADRKKSASKIVLLERYEGDYIVRNTFEDVRKISTIPIRGVDAIQFYGHNNITVDIRNGSSFAKKPDEDHRLALKVELANNKDLRSCILLEESSEIFTMMVPAKKVPLLKTLNYGSYLLENILDRI